MTEEEAKTKWCPFARLVVAAQLDNQGNPMVSQPQTTFNRIAVSGKDGPWTPHQGRCIGSACMAWRIQSYDGATDTQEGYCGLAGRP